MAVRSGSSWRLRLVQKIPSALLEAPFECIIAMFGLLAGFSQATGLSRPASFAALLPPWFTRGYGVVLIVAAISLLIGLRKGGANPPTTAGLRLCSCATAAYGVALLGGVGITAAAPALLFLMVSALCALRAFIITTTRREMSRVAVVADQE